MLLEYQSPVHCQRQMDASEALHYSSRGSVSCSCLGVRVCAFLTCGVSSSCIQFLISSPPCMFLFYRIPVLFIVLATSMHQCQVLINGFGFSRIYLFVYQDFQEDQFVYLAVVGLHPLSGDGSLATASLSDHSYSTHFFLSLSSC